MAGERTASMSTVRRLSDYEGDYNLYGVDIKYDYDLDAIIAHNIADDQDFMDAIAKEVLPNYEVSLRAPDFGCSAFRVHAADGTVLMGRNYDFRDDTSALMVRTSPEDGYAAIAFCALNTIMGNNVADAGEVNRAGCLFGPFASYDGINEKGVSIAVLTLDSEPTDQQTGKPVINTSLAIRLVLDRAASTQEAVDLLSSYDMHAAAGRDYHFFINDAQGDSRVVEYDPLDENRSLRATPLRQTTNYYALYPEQVKPNQRNGIYGHGLERALAIEAVLDAHEDDADEDVAWEALRASSQDPNPHDITSNTQWSIVFDNSHCTARIALRRHWEDVFSFSV